MEDLVGTELVTQGGGMMPLAEAMAGVKYVGFYFGAHWAPCCRRFTETLREEYAAINANGKRDLEVVFVSKDGNQAAFDRNFAEMPWKAIKYDDEARKKSLEQKYGIMEIPMLLVVRAANGQQVSENGVADLQNHHADVVEAWDKMVEANEAGAGAAEQQ